MSLKLGTKSKKFEGGKYPYKDRIIQAPYYAVSKPNTTKQIIEAKLFCSVRTIQKTNNWSETFLQCSNNTNKPHNWNETLLHCSKRSWNKNKTNKWNEPRLYCSNITQKFHYNYLVCVWLMNEMTLYLVILSSSS